jgi:hypothetical protein
MYNLLNDEIFFHMNFLNFKFIKMIFLDLNFFLNIIMFTYFSDLIITLLFSYFAVVGRVVRCVLLESVGLGNHDDG